MEIYRANKLRTKLTKFIEEPQLSQSTGKETQGCLKNVPNILGC